MEVSRPQIPSQPHSYLKVMRSSFVRKLSIETLTVDLLVGGGVMLSTKMCHLASEATSLPHDMPAESPVDS